MVQDPAFTTIGESVDSLNVSIGYRIIELFSAGLYSSPNKAVEELISNSYDALASRVDLLIPAAFTVEGAAIWVVDDGHGMNLEGLRDLWRIAESKKRERQSLDRLPIGKFGIGKLATYVLARDLTYLSHTNGTTLGVTMRYGQIQPDSQVGEQTLELDVRALSSSDLEAALAPLETLSGGSVVAARILNMSTSASEHSWTAVAMSDLKPLAQDLKPGRLRWILQNALPNSEDFKLYINNEFVPSKIEGITPLFAWNLGESPGSEAAGDTGIEIVRDVAAVSQSDKLRESVEFDDSGNISVRLPEVAGTICGRVEIYSDSLAVGRFADYGRSHGIFVRVRDRLVNLTDPLFGMPALSHKTFVRWRLVVNADGLDQLLATTREAVYQGPAIEALHNYIRAQFNLARRLYEAWLTSQEIEQELGTKISRTPRALSRRPLVNAIRQAVNGDIDGLILTDVPRGLNDAQREHFLEKLESDVESDDGLIASVSPSPLGIEQYIARYQPLTRVVLVNTLHPFYSNFVEDSKDDEAFRLLAATEVLTEAYLLEEGVEPFVVRQVLLRRDEFLRELVASKRRGAAAVADNLIQSQSNEKALENAVHEAMESLGYVVQRLAKSGQPEGVASAVIGARDETGQRADYRITYDAKSTGNRAVPAEHVNVSRLARHRVDYQAHFSLVVAPDFQGAHDPQSALNKEVAAEFQHGGRVTVMRAPQLALLIQLAVRRRLGYTRLRSLFETCRTVDDVTAWLKRELAEKEPQAPLKEILDVIIELQQRESDTDRLEVGSVKTALALTRGIDMKREELVEHLRSLKSLTGNYIFLDTDARVVSVDISAERVLAELGRYQQTLDQNLEDREYLKAFLDPPSLAGDEDEEGAKPGDISSPPGRRVPQDRKAPKKVGTNRRKRRR